MKPEQAVESEPAYQIPARQLEGRLASVAMKEVVDSALIMVAAEYRSVAASRRLCEDTPGCRAR